MRGSRIGGKARGPDPTENHKNKVFFALLVRWKNHKAPKSELNVGPPSARQRNAICPPEKRHLNGVSLAGR